jgi:hypothetical protein
VPLAVKVTGRTHLLPGAREVFRQAAPSTWKSPACGPVIVTPVMVAGAVPTLL